MTSWAANEMEVFAVFGDGQLWNLYWDGAAWHEWHAMGGELVGQPASSSRGADRIDVFATGRDGGLWHRWWNGSSGCRGGARNPSRPESDPSLYSPPC